MPSVNPLIDTVQAALHPLGVDSRSPDVSAPTPAPQGPGHTVNPYQGTVNDTNAAGTQEAVAGHVAAIIIVGLVGVYALRLLDFKFVVAAGVGG